MKNYILYICLLCGLRSFAQGTAEKMPKDTSDKASEERQEAFMKGLSTHGLLTQLTGEELDKAAPKITKFLEQYNYMHIKGNAVIKKGSVQYKYTKRDENVPANTLSITYFFIKKDNSKIITSCNISGYAKYITDLYSTYWPAKTDISNLNPGKKVYTTFLADRISIKLLPANKAEITVSSVADVDYTMLNEQKAKTVKRTVKTPQKTNKPGSQP